MNITPAQIYWITRLENIKVVAFAMTSLGFALGGVLTLPLMDPDMSDFHGGLKWWQRWLLVAGIVGALMLTFIPTKKEMAAILVIPRIANSKTVAEIGGDVKMLAVEWLEELRPNKKDGAAK